MTPQELLEHNDAARLWPAGCGLDVAAAYQRALAVRELRIARGERPRGYKVGFTNRHIWARYGVSAPVWGTVWDSTLSFCEGEGELSLAGTCQPRIEPEAVFGLTAAPPPQATIDELFGCIGWVAPGFEVVQSHRPDWKFTPGDAVADGSLHARLLVGPRVAAARVANSARAFGQLLAAVRVRLHRDGMPVEEGVGANVLDGPLHALGCFLRELRACPSAPDLQAGDVVTTGTWTDAWPVAPGQLWQAGFEAPLSTLRVRFT